MAALRTTGKIRVSLKNQDQIQYHLEQMQHRCSSNLTTYEELVEEAAAADAKLAEKGLRKTGAHLLGTLKFKKFDECKPRSRDFTRYELERTSRGWFVTEISRQKGGESPLDGTLTLPPASHGSLGRLNKTANHGTNPNLLKGEKTCVRRLKTRQWPRTATLSPASISSNE